ncbi:LOW QUALITY PROTEIN: uncharacterized protein LOC125757327 [Rhipicephalus sanguineus]|uniref:LOW QUALITY PROTEIN: uncharacterized protein LOC125757327 n=1 Tax=Rhipicephalus sanguineus TaxID=34632 RepID=UPI0020C4DA6E|nr:LOW QUALITY PROTEIN: uncharacterized protein LOC125757327 [Rhipicephalus sanguineus]
MLIWKTLVSFETSRLGTFANYKGRALIGAFHVGAQQHDTPEASAFWMESLFFSTVDTKAAARWARYAAAARARRHDPAVRAREAEAKRAHRQANPEVQASEARHQVDPALRCRKAEAERKRRQENPEEVRVRDVAAKRQKQSLPEVGGADTHLKRDFLDHMFGHSCKVCDRLWFDNSMTIIASIRNEQSCANAVAVLQREFPVAATSSAPPTDCSMYRVCSACKGALVAGKVPAMSVMHKYRYPPQPSHLPALNPIEERLIAPCLPFMSIRRLTHGSGQYGIKGQVVNVPIDWPRLDCLPRNVPAAAAFDVHIKRRLLNKPSYRKGLVKKRHVHAWLKHLEQSPLCKYLKIKIDWSRLVAQEEDDGKVNDDEIEPAPKVTDLDDPLQAAIALNLMSHTMFIDDAAIVNTKRDDFIGGAEEQQQQQQLCGLMTGLRSLHLAPGEGQTPISLLFDEYAEELSFLQIYLGVPRQITGPRPTPFAKASSEIHWTDHRGVGPEHVLYMAMKVMRHNVAEKTMTFKTNAATSASMRQQFETG